VVLLRFVPGIPPLPPIGFVGDAGGFVDCGGSFYPRFYLVTPHISLVLPDSPRNRYRDFGGMGGARQ
jgi:hypothetical protein